MVHCVMAWVSRFIEATKSEGATWATPPVQHGRVILIYWDTLAGSDDGIYGDAPNYTEYHRWGHGTWWRLRDVHEVRAPPNTRWECEAVTCSHCGRPLLLSSTLTAPSSPAMPSTTLPHLFCPHLQGMEAQAAMTIDVANRCWTLTPYGRERGAAAVTTFQWGACEPESLRRKGHVAQVNPQFKHLEPNGQPNYLD